MKYLKAYDKSSNSRNTHPLNHQIETGFLKKTNIYGKYKWRERPVLKEENPGAIVIKKFGKTKK